MLALIARRALAGVFVLWLVHLATFAALRAMPGDAWGDLAGDRELPAAAVARLKHLYFHDQPILAQYIADLSDKLRGEFGYSLKLARGQAVAGLLARAAPVSLSLGSGALLVGLFLGLFGGALAARRPGGSMDASVRGLATLGVSVPDFVLATLLLIVFALALGWFPAGGIATPSAMVLPIATLALPLAAAIARLTRASLMGELRADFVRTARAKGAGESSVIVDHALRPAFGPVLAYLAPAAANLLTGAMVVESLFVIPGLGYYFVAGALAQDWPVVTAAALAYAAALVMLNLAADLALAWLDPRTR